MRSHKENSNLPIKRKTMARKQTANTFIETTKELLLKQQTHYAYELMILEHLTH
jgi:hypothetical protein